MIELQAKEQAILDALTARRGRPVGRDELIDTVWPLPPRGSVSTLRVHISNLRAKRPELAIGYAPGHGYILAL